MAYTHQELKHKTLAELRGMGAGAIRNGENRRGAREHQSGVSFA